MPAVTVAAANLSRFVYVSGALLCRGDDWALFAGIKSVILSDNTLQAHVLQSRSDGTGNGYSVHEHFSGTCIIY